MRRFLDVRDPVAGRLGLVSAAAILIAAFITAIPYVGYAGEGYSPLNHFISELGEVGRSRLALLFDATIALGGLGLMLFLVMVSRRMSGRYRQAMAVVGVLAGVSGMLVGFFPMNTLLVHRIVSGAFFLTCWLTAAVFTLWLARSRGSSFPRWLLAPAAFAVAVDFVFVGVYSTYHPVDPDAPILARADIWSVPLLEWASLLSLLLWLICVAWVLARTRRPVH